MKYACLVYHSQEKLFATPDAEIEEIMRDCGEWLGDLERAGKHVFSTGLQSVSSATTLRTLDGRLSATDGPFTETKEFLAGFTIFEARDLNEALQVASKMPANRIGTVELRPALDPSLDLDAPVDRKIAGCLRRVIHAATASAV